MTATVSDYAIADLNSATLALARLAGRSSLTATRPIVTVDAKTFDALALLITIGPGILMRGATRNARDEFDYNGCTIKRGAKA